jgi:RNAse (barnase) inhibitor barstar
MCISAHLAAQPTSQRRIYLWDVTLSMKGYQGKTPDIYDDVVKFLEKEINSISDPTTELVVLPFQERVLETWKANADMEGKKDIISKIKSYKNNEVTNTNIIGPIQYVQQHIIKPDKDNLLVLLTDGKNSPQFGGSDAMKKFTNDWPEYAKINNAYALYIKLTEEADEGGISATTGLDVVPPEGGLKKHILITPSGNATANIKDDSASNFAMDPNSTDSLPEGIKVRVYSLDSIVNIDEIVTLKDRKIVFSLILAQPYDSLKNVLDEYTVIPVKLELLNANEFKEYTIRLTKDIVNLRLINKPEKTLKISVKK